VSDRAEAEVIAIMDRIEKDSAASPGYSGRLLQSSPVESDQFSHIRPQVFLDLFRAASSKTLTRAGAATAAAWLPLAVLTAIHGGAAFRSFLTDYATLSRLLIIIPVLILAEPPLHERLARVARHFESFLVSREQLPKFQAHWTSCEKLRNSKLVFVLILMLTYATAAWLGKYLRGAEFPDWWNGDVGFRVFSLAGTWAVFVSYPILLYLTYLWLWRQLIWARFLLSTTRLNLRLIAAHPDHLGGLGFIEASLRGQVPFSFCIGVGLAGGVASRIFIEGEKLSSFRHLPLVLIAAVLLVCVAPYLVFISTLAQMRRQGKFRYGAFARAVGEQFELKWLDRADSLDQDVLTAPDFSTTTDLYGIVGNIESIRVIPVGAFDLYALIGAGLIPGIPVVIASIPFDTVIEDALKLLF
jgi:hypothetical protein